MAQEHMSEAPPELREMADGVAFWRSRPKWPADFHNSDYEKLALQNPNGNFTLTWWQQFLPTLKAWIATRPASDADLTARFTDGAKALSAAWRSACLPFLSGDISSLTW